MKSLTRIVSFLSLVALAVACSKAPTEPQGGAAAKAEAPAKVAEPAPVAPAPAPAVPVPSGQKFGAGVLLTEVTPIAEILAEPKKFAGKTVRVEGMITDVCPKRGCWFEMASDQPGKKLRFKVTDGEMVFPVDSKGQTAVAEGVVTVKDLTLDETKAYLKDQAEEYGLPYDEKSITEPKAIVQISGTGAVFLAKN